MQIKSISWETFPSNHLGVNSYLIVIPHSVTMKGKAAFLENMNISKSFLFFLK